MNFGFQCMRAAVPMVILSCLLTACDSQLPPTDDPVVSGSAMVSDEPVVSNGDFADDKPTIPDHVAEGIDYLYDFRFSERYDDRVSDEFSLALPSGFNPSDDTLFLFENYQTELVPISEASYDGDGMVPHMYQRYWYTFETGDSLLVQTDFYEPDDVEYISCVWTDIEGASTNQNVAVGSTEAELLSAYTEDLFYLEQDAAEPAVAKFEEDYDAGFAFDYAYAWQPFTGETNDIRDITFYIKDGKVASIEMMNPFELRYVYGYDGDAGLQYANEKRSELVDQ